MKHDAARAVSGSAGSRGGLGSALLRAAAGLLSSGGRCARLLVLAYHRVLARPDSMRACEIDAEVFERHVRVLAQQFNVLPLPEAVARLQRGDLKPRSLCISFDDGYADNHDVAYPILRRWGLPATFFVATGYLDGEVMWNDAIVEIVRQAPGVTLDLRRLGLDRYAIGTPPERARSATSIVLGVRYFEPARRAACVEELSGIVGAAAVAGMMMNAVQVRALAAAGMDIGGHTVSHPILSRVSTAQAWSEITQGKERLESITGAPVTLFAYPNGRPGADYGAEHVAMVQRAGFTAAFTTVRSAARPSADPYQLPRVMPWDRSPLKFSLRLLRSYITRPATPSA